MSSEVLHFAYKGGNLNSCKQSMHGDMCMYKEVYVYAVDMTCGHGKASKYNDACMDMRIFCKQWEARLLQ